MTPHYPTTSQHTVKPNGPDQKGPYTRSRRGNSVGEEIQCQPNALEDIFEHRNDLKREDVLSTVVPNLEDRLLPSVVFGARLDSLPLGSRVRIDIDNRPGLTDFECGHEWCLRGVARSKQGHESLKRGINHLGMTLQWTPGLPVDIDDLTIRITGEVNSNVNHNPGHLLVNLRLASVKSGQPPVTDACDHQLPSFRTFPS